MLFREIVGQSEVKKKLIQTVKENRISHAQLFTGNEGVGKLPLAIAYAQYVSCENRQGDDSCGVCASCIKYEKLIHPDLHFLFPIANITSASGSTTKASCFNPDTLQEWRNSVQANPYLELNEWLENIEIENKQATINAKDCNEIIKILGLKTYESEFKVVIIWMLEKLYHSAAPKLLKILEEPPDKTLFLLISENPEQVVKTILSRTQIVKVPRISDEDIRSALKKKYDESQSKINYAVNLADGNYFEAVNILSKSDKEKSDFNFLISWLRLCYKPEFAKISDWVDEISKTGRERQKLFLNYALHLIKECFEHNGCSMEFSNIEETEKEVLENFSKLINVKNVLKIYEELNTASFHIERNAYPKILFMDLSIKMAHLLRL
ncbi:MAG: DNA polymerase III subunit delta [Bacteroidales bacterium]|nr:DNA polymerase III subunit delta [Bacteroidales bacterium]